MSEPNEWNAKALMAGQIRAQHITELTLQWQSMSSTYTGRIDGKCGPLTREDIARQWEQPPTWDDLEPTAPTLLEAFDGPLGLNGIPSNRRQVYEVFGNPGVGRVDRAWKRDNIVTVRDLPGVPRKWHVKVHRLAEPYFREALRRARHNDVTYDIKRAGAFVFRHQRHDSERPLSYHSWGIAIDIDAQQNRAIRFETGARPGQAPAPWSSEWRQLWPHGLSESFVAAFESVGFIWAGRWRKYIDPMHMQLVGWIAETEAGNAGQARWPRFEFRGP